MNILSLFDGISCARVALGRVGIPIKTYYASEIDKHAIQISTKNYPEIVRLGDVREIQSLPASIDLLIGGSPCQDLSIAKKDRKGLEGERSSLFWEYKRILDLVKPTYFVLENVASMPKADRDSITKALGVEPVMINASLVSAQCRKRLFWTNIPGITQPADRGILLKDILQPEAEVDESMTVNGKSFCLTASYHKTGEGQKEYEHNKKTKQRTMVKVGYIGEGEQYGQGGQAHRVYDLEGKTPTLSSFGPLIKVGHIGNTDSQTNRVYSPEGKAPTQCKGPNGGALPTLVRVGHIGNTDAQANRVYDPDGKSVTLSANGGGLGAKTGLYLTKRQEANLRDLNEKAYCLTSTNYKGSQANGTTLVETTRIRKLTPVECERLQGLPDNYTEGVAKTHRYKCLGNAFNVDVVAHIFSHIKICS